MTTMQAKLTAEFQAMIEAGGWEFITSPEAANTGIWLAQEGLDTALVIRYNFQPNYVTLTFTGARVNERAVDQPRDVAMYYKKAVASKEGRFEYTYVAYRDGEALRKVLQLTYRLLHDDKETVEVRVNERAEQLARRAKAGVK